MKPLFFEYRFGSIEQRNYFYSKWSQHSQKTYPGDPAKAEFQMYNGGVTTAGYTLYKDPEFKDSKIGIMVAGNSGRPGGAIGGLKGVIVKSVHPYHKTQEEDIVSNWLMTYAGDLNELFLGTIHKKWGMLVPQGSTSVKTIQGIDYKKTTNPERYADAWVVDYAILSKKRQSTIDSDIIKDLKTIDPAMYFNALGYELDKTFPAILVWVAGPNAGFKGTPEGSGARTFNFHAANNWNFFRESIKWSIRAGLDAMIARSVDIALVAQISSGVYSGPHKSKIKKELLLITNEILNEPVCNVVGAPPRGIFFRRAIIPLIIEPLARDWTGVGKFLRDDHPHQPDDDEAEDIVMAVEEYLGVQRISLSKLKHSDGSTLLHDELEELGFSKDQTHLRIANNDQRVLEDSKLFHYIHRYLKEIYVD